MYGVVLVNDIHEPCRMYGVVLVNDIHEPESDAKCISYSVS